MSSVLVLNADFSALQITSVKRAIVLVAKGKAEIVKHEARAQIRSEKIAYGKPLIIRLLRYIAHQVRRFKVSRSRIYKRDQHQCVYCGSRKNLTLDHVLPRSRGGSNDWANLVTCCLSCNLKKGNRTPEEANMKLPTKPAIPDFFTDRQHLKDALDDFMRSFGL